jgi:hypothetical protein
MMPTTAISVGWTTLTRENGNRVSLSVRDWFALVGIAFGIFTACAAGYLRIDRSLSGLSIGQAHQAEVIKGLNQDIQRLEARLMGMQ